MRWHLYNLTYFNPRSHERSDSLFGVVSDFLGISIHAPTRGATLSSGMFPMVLVFQSTLPREERLSSRKEKGLYKDFNPRSHERSDRNNEPIRLDSLISIHAPTRGATMWLIVINLLQRFQSTLPREERQQYCTKNLFIFIQYRQ